MLATAPPTQRLENGGVGAIAMLWFSSSIPITGSSIVGFGAEMKNILVVAKPAPSHGFSSNIG